MSLLRVPERDHRRSEMGRARDELHRALTGAIAGHFGTLSLRRVQTVVADVYGRRDRSAWERELQAFTQDFAPPHLVEAYGRDKLAALIEQMLDEHERTAPAIDADYAATMSGEAFERLVASSVRRSGATVRATARSGDQGLDLIASVALGEIGIQCKRSMKPIGNGAVQEVAAGRAFYRTDHAWVVSDAPFTRQARQLAASLNVALIDFRNIDGALAALGNRPAP